jgi:hypothetical protein
MVVCESESVGVNKTYDTDVSYAPVEPAVFSDLYLSDNIFISIRSSIFIYRPLRSFLHYNMPPIPYVNTNARTAEMLFQTAMLIRSAAKIFISSLYTLC